MLAGQLASAQLLRAEAHVDSCASCRILIGKVADSVASAETVGDDRTSRPKLEAAPKQIGRYEVERQIGAGGMGVVLLAEDSDLKRKVVIKLIRPGTGGEEGSAGRERLLREAQAMAKVSHVNVVPIYDVGVHDGQVFLAMEYIEGGDLAAWLKEQRPVDAVLSVFVQAGRGLAAAHRAGLVHRDFKPHNVLLGNHGEVKVTDFGLARAELSTGDRPLDRSRPRVSTAGNDLSVATLLASPITHTGAMVGTPAYMAPEQILVEGVDGRTDQFSFCVALHEALYGKRPFTGATPEELFEATLSGKLVDVPDRRVPARVRKALLRGLSVEPKDRFPTMDALLAELAPRRRVWWFAGGALAAAIAATVVITVVMTRSTSEPPCTNLDGGLAGAWDADIAKKLHAAFSTAGGAKASPAVAAILDRYEASWTATRVDVCKATRVRGEQSEQVLAHRNACLEMRARELRVFTKRVIDDAASLHTRAGEAATKLVPPTTCATLTAVAHPLPANTKPMMDLYEELADVGIDMVLGSTESVRTKIESVLRNAEHVPYPPMQTDSYLLAASTTRYAGDLVQTETYLRKALKIAELGQYDLGRAKAMIALADLQVARGDLASAQNSIEQADATLARIGGSAEHGHALLRVRALVSKAQNKPAETLALFEQLLAEQKRLHGEESLQYAVALVDVASSYFDAGRSDEARAAYDRSQQILGKLFPGTGAVDILQITHEQTTALMTGEPRRALELAERALVLMKKQQGFPEKMLAQQYTTIGICRFMLEEYALARDAYIVASEVYEKANVRDEAAITYELAGRAELELKQYDAALALFRKSAELAKAVDPKSEQYVMSRQGIGRVLVELGSVDDAISELEWVLPRLESRTPPPRNTIGATRLALADILWRRARPGDRERAKASAAQALEDMRAHRAQFTANTGAQAFYIRIADKQIARADKWIADHK